MQYNTRQGNAMRCNTEKIDRSRINRRQVKSGDYTELTNTRFKENEKMTQRTEREWISFFLLLR